MKVGIVEDQVLYQRYVSDLVARELEFEMVLCCADATTALSSCERSGVELLVLDLKIQGMYGIELAEKLLELIPNLKILAYSVEVDTYNLRMVDTLGILGFLDKSDPIMRDDEFLIQAIQKVAKGKRVFTPGVESMMKEMALSSDSFHKLLSPRKIEILKYIGQCMNDDEICALTGLSSHTVRKHRIETMQLLGLDSNHRLIRYAQKNGFSHLPSYRSDSA